VCVTSVDAQERTGRSGRQFHQFEPHARARAPLGPLRLVSSHQGPVGMRINEMPAIRLTPVSPTGHAVRRHFGHGRSARVSICTARIVVAIEIDQFLGC